MTQRYALLLCLCSCVLSGYRFPFFGKKESTVQRESIKLPQKHVLHIKNDRGSVNIKTGNTQNAQIEMHAVGPEDYIDYIHLAQEETKKSQIITAKLSEAPQTEKHRQKPPRISDFSIDYYITLPEQAGVMVTSDGNISVAGDRISGPITINGSNITTTLSNIKDAISIDVDKGDITINTAHNGVSAHTANGSATLTNIQGELNASAYYHIEAQNLSNNAFIRTRGFITVTDANAVLNAQTRDGMKVIQNKMKPNTSMFLQARYLNLYVPSQTNAHLYAETTRGMITSEIPITLSPVTTRLTKEIWQAFKRNVTGTLGNGGATIRIDAGGNVQIHELT